MVKSETFPKMTHGFKEWQVVCDALASGRQSIIFRKGGIHEGRTGFSFAQERFYLFPTRFHNQAEHVREGACEALPEWQPGEMVTITHFCEAIWAKTLTDWSKVDALAPYHIWTEETIRQRFDWEGKGMSTGSIHVALVRTAALSEPWTFPYEAKYGGCRSWINLPEPPAHDYIPVMGDDAFSSLHQLLLSRLG
jgi:hypothetical protein